MIKQHNMQHVIAFKREAKFCPIQVGGKFQRSDSVPVPNQQGSENLANQMESQAVRNEPVPPMNDLPSELDRPYMAGQGGQTQTASNSGLADGRRPQAASNEPNWAMNAFPDRLQLTNMVNQMSQQPTVSQPAESQG